MRDVAGWTGSVWEITNGWFEYKMELFKLKNIAGMKGDGIK